jgi:hypothetical protein
MEKAFAAVPLEVETIDVTIELDSDDVIIDPPDSSDEARAHPKIRVLKVSRSGFSFNTVRFGVRSLQGLVAHVAPTT